jgi:hypothetical protein
MVLIAGERGTRGFPRLSLWRRLVFLNKRRALLVCAQATHADCRFPNYQASRYGSLRDSHACHAMATSGNVRLQILRVRADKRGMLRGDGS